MSSSRIVRVLACEGRVRPTSASPASPRVDLDDPTRARRYQSLCAWADDANNSNNNHDGDKKDDDGNDHGDSQEDDDRDKTTTTMTTICTRV